VSQILQLMTAGAARSLSVLFYIGKRIKDSCDHGSEEWAVHSGKEVRSLAEERGFVSRRSSGCVLTLR